MKTEAILLKTAVICAFIMGPLWMIVNGLSAQWIFASSAISILTLLMFLINHVCADSSKNENDDEEALEYLGVDSTVSIPSEIKHQLMKNKDSLC